MLRVIYLIILVYFVLGGIGFYLINRKRDRETARKSYTKYGFYFLIINVLFFSIAIEPLVFHYLSLVIMAAGLVEISTLFARSGSKHLLFFVISVMVFMGLSFLFYSFGLLPRETILFTFLILSIFDSFSQIAGQLSGRRKIMPAISPGKTLEGLLGGIFISFISAFLLRSLLDVTVVRLLIYTAGILLFAFLGDMLSSLFKRKYKVKDFNNLIPGHGGFLDRFDSLIAGGAWAVLFNHILQL